jgi:hypothetical protein
LSGCGTDVWLLDPLPLTLRSQKDLPLSTEEWARAARLVRKADRLAFVAARVLARMLLARTASCEPRVIGLVAQVSRPRGRMPFWYRRRQRRPVWPTRASSRDQISRRSAAGWLRAISPIRVEIFLLAVHDRQVGLECPNGLIVPRASPDWPTRARPVGAFVNLLSIFSCQGRGGWKRGLATRLAAATDYHHGIQLGTKSLRDG